MSETEKASLVQHLGQKKAMILSNHGLLTCGSSIEEAFLLMYYLWMACKIQVAALSSVGYEGVTKLPKEIVEFTRSNAFNMGTKQFGVKEFDALVRVFINKDDSYKR